MVKCLGLAPKGKKKKKSFLPFGPFVMAEDTVRHDFYETNH